MPPTEPEDKNDESLASALKRFKSGERAYHGRMRRQQHHAAQQEHANSDRQPVLEHPLVPAGSPQLIQSQSDLVEAIAHLHDAGSFAYDTEFIGELTYYPRLCMIQVASTQRVILIDPLAEVDLNPLWEILADPSVQKILHAGSQDLEPVARHLGRVPASVVDTQIAAGFVGLPYPLSLRELVRELVGARMNKGATFTEWDRRPLAPMQLEYAADDVRYLPAAWETISRLLEKLGHRDWAFAECQKLCRLETYAFNLDAQVGRVKGSGTLSGRRLTVLRELVLMRDQAARQQDVPVRTLLRDEVLINLAKRQPMKAEELRMVGGLPRPVEQAYGPQLLEAVTRGQNAPVVAAESSAAHHSETPAQRIAIDSLWAL